MDELRAVAPTVFVAIGPPPVPPGPAHLQVFTGSCSDFELFVGPAGGPTTCLVQTGLPACTFNPTIQEIVSPGFDCNGNGAEDIIDFAFGVSQDVDSDGIPDECGGTIPTISNWGLAILGLMILVVGKLFVRGRRTVWDGQSVSRGRNCWMRIDDQCRRE